MLCWTVPLTRVAVPPRACLRRLLQRACQHRLAPLARFASPCTARECRATFSADRGAGEVGEGAQVAQDARLAAQTCKIEKIVRAKAVMQRELT